MITYRKVAARLEVQRGETYVRTCVPIGGFGELLELEDERLPPQTLLLARTPPETLFYLSSGALKNAEPDGAAILVAGALQRVAGIAPRVRINASSSEWARVFRIRLRADEQEVALGGERAWFSSAERRGRLRLVASPDARGGSLQIRPGVSIYSSLLDAGQHIVCELPPGHRAWLQMVRGSATVLGSVLDASDSAAIEGCSSFGVTAREGSEVLLFDLAG